MLVHKNNNTNERETIQRHKHAEPSTLYVSFIMNYL